MLLSVTPTFDKNEHGSPPEEDCQLAISSVRGGLTTGDAARIPPPADPDQAYKRSPAVLSNNPYVDPLAIQKLTGKNVALGIAGNRFFNPFVWEKLYYFRLTYDESGRVSRAQELGGPAGTPSDFALEFEWSGMQLNAIRGFQAKTKVYERTMQYQDGKLVSEDIQGSAKASRIKAFYAGNPPQEWPSAITTTRASDNRSRKVAFAGNAASTQVK